jgi:hypothetical protein
MSGLFFALSDAGDRQPFSFSGRKNFFESTIQSEASFKPSAKHELLLDSFRALS